MTLRVNEQKIKKKLGKNVEETTKPMLETSFLKGSTIQAVTILHLTT